MYVSNSYIEFDDHLIYGVGVGGISIEYTDLVRTQNKKGLPKTE